MIEKVKRTGITGLDFLLNGGFGIHGGKSYSILVKGNVGTGKTTLSLQIAVNFAKQGDVGVYYSLEQPPEDLKNTVYGFNWSNKEPFVLAVGGDIHNKIKQVDNKGGLLISTVPKEHFGVMTEFIFKNVASLEEQVKRTLNFVVIDSISAIGEGKVLRSSFNNLIDKISEKNGRILIVTLEEQETQEGLSTIEEFLVDGVMRLGYMHRTERKDYLERYIEIVKMRNQFYYRGRHAFSIVDPEKRALETGKDESEVKGGIYIYPSMAANLSYQSRMSLACRKGEKEERERFKFGIETLDQLLYDGGEEKVRGGVASKSTTFIIGERGTEKTVIALHFLADGIKKKEKGLLISLKDDEYAIREVAKEYEALKRLAEENEYLQIEYIPPSYITPGNILCTVRNWIEMNKEIKRVVFDNFAQIRVRFPLLNADPMFIPTLINLFKTKEIASLFIDIIEETGGAFWEHKSPILDLADYVMVTLRLAFLGRDSIVVSVRRSREGKHKAEPAEVWKENNRIIVDDRAFEGITGVLEKNPQPVQLLLKLFCENPAERKFNEEIENELVRKYENLRVSSFSRIDSPWEYGHLKRYWIEGPRSIVKVVSLDEHWVKYAANENMLWKIYKDWFAQEEGKDWLEKDKRDFLSGTLKPATVNGDLYAIPNYIDFGLFCYRKDLFKELSINEEEIPKNFDDLIELIQSKSDDIKKQNLWGFAFDMEVEETLVCTFLEFLFNMSTANGKVGEKFLAIGDEKKRRVPNLSDEEVEVAAIQVLETLKNLKEKEIMPYPCTLDHCKDSLFARLWYSNVQSIYDLWQGINEKDEVRKNELRKKYKNAKFGTMKFPAIKRTYKDEEHYACSGSWYLGVLKQSLRPRLGYHLIDEIVSMDKNLLRAQLGAGFPVRKSFYKFHGKKNVKNVDGLTFNEIKDSIEGGEEYHRKLCRREIICANDVELYRKIRPIIADEVLNVLEGKREPKKAVDEIANVIRKKQKKSQNNMNR